MYGINRKIDPGSALLPNSHHASREARPYDGNGEEVRAVHARSRIAILDIEDTDPTEPVVVGSVVVVAA